MKKSDENDGGKRDGRSKKEGRERENTRSPICDFAI